MRRLAHVATTLGLGLGLALLASGPSSADAVDDTVDVAGPAGITTNADGTQVYVAAYDAGGLSVVDTATGRVLDLPGVTAPYDVAVSPDSTRAYVTGSTLTGVVAVMDTTTGTVVTEVDTGAFPQAVVMTPAGDEVWAANFGRGRDDSTVTVIATKTNKVTANITVGKHPTAVAFAPDGTQAYVTDADLTDEASGTVAVIDTKSHRTTATVEVGRWPTAVAVSPDGTRAFVTDADSGSLVVIDTESSTVAETVEVGAWPTDVALTADGARAYVTNAESDTVSVVDTATLTVTDTVEVLRPQAVVVSDSTRAWVTSRALNQVTVLDLDTSPAFVTSVLRSGQVTQPYQAQINLTGTDPTFEVTDGQLPAGLTLDAATGEITGTPTTAGEYAFTLTATATVSGIPATVSADYQIRVDPAPADGSASTTVTEPSANTEASPNTARLIVWAGVLTMLAACAVLVVRQRA
ncbi:MAG: putative Ig domain-containing protein [Cellulomonas sp.]|jgi:YVTN family beta-propeller protein|nr:putative Ig domain-containing protein [Cellulomonas sp.]